MPGAQSQVHENLEKQNKKIDEMLQNTRQIMV